MAAAGKDKKMLKSFLAAVQLSASVERFFVSPMRDFFYKAFFSENYFMVPKIYAYPNTLVYISIRHV